MQLRASPRSPAWPTNRDDRVERPARHGPLTSTAAAQFRDTNIVTVRVEPATQPDPTAGELSRESEERGRGSRPRPRDRASKRFGATCSSANVA